MCFGCKLDSSLNVELYDEISDDDLCSTIVYRDFFVCNLFVQRDILSLYIIIQTRK
jgi:hypothetical protein